MISRFASLALIIVFTSICARAETAACNQVLVETTIVRIHPNKVPADIARMLAQNAKQPTESLLLTAQQQDELLLKAANGKDGQVIASPTLLMLAGSEAEIRNVLLRRYVASLAPTLVNNASMYTPTVKDAEKGLTLKLKAEPSADGRSVKLTFSHKLISMLSFGTFTYQENGRNETLAIQQPRSEEVAIGTTVTVPDGKTLLLGGLTAYFPDDTPNDTKGYKQTVLFLVRPTLLGHDTLPKGTLPTDATIVLQTKFVAIPSDFATAIHDKFLPRNQPPILDDARADAFVKAVQPLVTGAIVTSPRLTLTSGNITSNFARSKHTYVGSFTLEKDPSVPSDPAGQLKYKPKLEFVEDGYSVKFRADAVPDRNAFTVSADISLADLAGLNSFSFVEKPEKITLQQPTRHIISANLQACIPDKNWLVIGPLRTEGRVETEVRPSWISRLFGEKPRRDVRPYASDLYILIRPEAQLSARR